MRGQRPSTRGDHERNLTAGEELLWTNPARIDRLEVEIIFFPQLIFDRDPQRPIGTGEGRVTDSEVVQPGRSKARRRKNQRRDDCAEANQTISGCHFRPPLCAAFDLPVNTVEGDKSSRAGARQWFSLVKICRGNPMWLPGRRAG